MQKKIIRRPVADSTRVRIIEAAHQLFAESGFSGTTTQAIAAAAQVNETLIFHHFGKKAELWKQVKAAVLASIPVEPLDPQPTSLHDFLHTIISQRISAYAQQPDLIRLLQWQRLESKQDQLKSDNILAPKNWLVPIQYLKKTGQIKADIPAEVLIIWLQVSINAIIFDNIPYLQERQQRACYINSLLAGFERALS